MICLWHLNLKQIDTDISCKLKRQDSKFHYQSITSVVGLFINEIWNEFICYLN